MRLHAFTVEGIPFRPLLEQIFSRLLLRSANTLTRTLGGTLLAISTLELIFLAISDLESA